jgi:hypothetical protein
MSRKLKPVMITFLEDLDKLANPSTEPSSYQTTAGKIVRKDKRIGALASFEPKPSFHPKARNELLSF